MITDLVFYLVAIPALLITGASKGGVGGGLGILAVPLIAMTVSTTQTTGILLPVLCLMDGLAFWIYRKAWDFKNLRMLVPAAFIGMAAGTLGFHFFNENAIRLMIGWKALSRDVLLLFAPHHVIAVTAGGKAIPNDSARAVLSFGIAFVLCWGLGTLLLTIGEHSLETASSAAIAALSNVGPGLGEVGPAGNFASFAGWQKIVLIILMWLGRLELFAVLALLQKSFWRR